MVRCFLGFHLPVDTKKAAVLARFKKQPDSFCCFTVFYVNSTGALLVVFYSRSRHFPGCFRFGRLLLFKRKNYLLMVSILRYYYYYYVITLILR